MKKEYEMMKELKRLGSIRGSGTELITVYIPAGYQISEEVARLREEYSQSSNIKSKTTRTNVLSAIDKIMQYLKLFKEAPKNGLAIFCGNVSDNPGKVDIELFSMEPPMPLNINVYRCDSTFLLEPIEEMVEAKDVFALVVMDGREATIATLKGSHVQVIKKLASLAHAKVRKGGQSAARYERAIEESIEDYYKIVADVINSLFEQRQFKVKGLIVGGPGPTKENFSKTKGLLNYQIKILGVYDTGYTDEYGLREMLDKARDLLKDQEVTQEVQVLERFMSEVGRNGLAVYGYWETKKAIASKQAGKLIINEDLELHEQTRKISATGQMLHVLVSFSGDARKRSGELIWEEDSSGAGHYIKSAQERIDKYNEVAGSSEVVEEKDAIDEAVEMADVNGVETVFVSN